MRLAVPGVGVHVEAQLLALLQLHRPLGEGAEPQLGALQVHQDGDRVIVFLLERAELLDPLAMIVVRAVAEVQAEDVGAGLEQGAQALGRRSGGPQGGDDLGEALTTHGSSLLLRRRHFEVTRLLVDLYHGGVIQPAPAGACGGQEKLVGGGGQRQRQAHARGRYSAPGRDP